MGRQSCRIVVSPNRARPLIRNDGKAWGTNPLTCRGERSSGQGRSRLPGCPWAWRDRRPRHRRFWENRVARVAEGGAPIPENGHTPVWEPFLLLHRDRLICYYSDQRDPDHGQKLAHQTSRDLRTWGPVVDDAVGTDYNQRPGMTTVAQVRHDLWIMTYEAGGDSGDNFYAVHYKLAKDPESFGPARAVVLHDQDGYIPSAAPTVSWSDSGGPMGTIVVTANSDQDLFINRHLGHPDRWTRLSSAVPGGYSRFTIALPSTGPRRQPGLVFVVTGPYYAENGPIQAGVVQLA